MVPNLLAAPLLVVDIGNTSIKWGVSNIDGSVDSINRSRSIDETLLRLHEMPDRPGYLAVARSGNPEHVHRILDFASTVGMKSCLVAARLPAHIPSRYSPGEAGTDRIANVIAALKLFRPPIIVVDAGSAITTEVIGPRGDFLGGSIMPGFPLLAQSLHKGTIDLPEVQIATTPCFIGTDTNAAMQAGIYAAGIGAVRFMIEETRKELQISDAQLIITGGDAEILVQALEQFHAQLVPDLTLCGIALLAREQFASLD